MKVSKRKPVAAAVAVAAFLTVLLSVPQLHAAAPKHLSKTEVKALIANAKTPEDHSQLARHYRSEADRLEVEAKDHDELAAAYRESSSSQAAAMKNPMAGNTVAHCEYFAKSDREAAKAARELAAEHEQMAKQASTPTK